MKKVLVTALFLGLTSFGFTEVQETNCLYSTSTVITVSSSAVTVIAPVNGQKNIEIQNMDSANTLLIASSSTWKIGTIPGPQIVAGDYRIWENFNGAFCLIVYPDQASITVGITRQMYRRYPSNY